MVHIQHPAPLCVFAYNRPEKLWTSLRTIERNVGATDTYIRIYIDGPKTDKDVPLVKKTIDIANEAAKGGFKKVDIIASVENKGLANSVISGVSEVVSDYKKVIVLEDDLIASNNFLLYMNESLNFYQQYEKVGSISGFGFKVTPSQHYDNFFHKRPNSWGWATWLNNWDKAIWDLETENLIDSSFKKEFNKGGEDLFRMLGNYQEGVIDSWAIRWAYTHYKLGWVASCPYYSKIVNDGYSEAGTHCRGDNPIPTRIDNGENFDFVLRNDLNCDLAAAKEMDWYNSNMYKLLYKSKLLKLKTIFSK